MNQWSSASAFPKRERRPCAVHWCLFAEVVGTALTAFPFSVGAGVCSQRKGPCRTTVLSMAPPHPPWRTMKEELRKILSAATYYGPRPDQVRIKTETRKLFDECLELTKGDASAAANLVLADALLSPATEPPALWASETLTVAEAAKELNLHRQTIYRLCQSGALTSYRFRRAVRIPRQGIEKFKAKVPNVPSHEEPEIFDHIGNDRPKR